VTFFFINIGTKFTPSLSGD